MDAPRRLDFDVAIANGPWESSYFIKAVGVGLVAETMSGLDARGNIDLAHANFSTGRIRDGFSLLFYDR